MAAHLEDFDLHSLEVPMFEVNDGVFLNKNSNKIQKSSKSLTYFSGTLPFSDRISVWANYLPAVSNDCSYSVILLFL